MLKTISFKASYLALVPFFFLSISVFAQRSAALNDVKTQTVSSEVWQKAMVNVDGTHIVYGVEVLYRRTSCNSQEQILLKFVNSNSEDVLIEWSDGIYTEDKKWIMNERNDKARELKLKAKSQIEGACEDDAAQILRIDLSEYLSDNKQSFSYAPAYLDITKAESNQK